MKKLLIATVLTAACGIGGATFASANVVQNFDKQPIKMELLAGQNQANDCECKNGNMPFNPQNAPMHNQDQMGYMPLMHHKGDQMRSGDQNEPMRPQGRPGQMGAEGHNHQMPPQGKNGQGAPQGQPPQGQPPQGPNGQGVPQTTQNQ